VSLDAVLFVLMESFPRILELRPQIAALLPELDLGLLDRLPLYTLDFFHYGAMTDLARVLGPASPLDANQWDSERDGAARLLMDAYEQVRGAVALVGGDPDRVAPALAASSEDRGADTDFGIGPIAAAA
jgi:hypothetical protein